MGKVVITAQVGGGLYQARRVASPALAAELSRLQTQDAEHWKTLLKAIRAVDDLRREKREAADGLNEVVQQWKDALIDKLNEAPPEIPPPIPNDPATGVPWEDPDRSQEAPLLALVNALRTTALTRNAALDSAILRQVRYVAETGQVSHSASGQTASYQTAIGGYYSDPAVGVGQVMAYGTRTPAATLATWIKRSSDNSKLLDPDYTECGVAFVYAPDNPYGYLWGMILAAPGPPPGAVEPDDNPAQEAADTTEGELQKIELPTVETFEPKKLSEVAARLATAAQKLRAGEQEKTRLQAEHLSRETRIAELTATIAALNTPMDIWTHWYTEDIVVGTELNTADVPGYWIDDATARTSTINEDLPTERDVSYTERSFNITDRPWRGGWTQPVSQVVPADAVTDAQAFVNIAIEPGHLRWKPIWRYGILTAVNPAVNQCNLTLNAISARPISGEEAMALDEVRALTAVPIDYPCPEVFVVGDEVLVLFSEFNRDQPKVIGFRRNPRRCREGRFDWSEEINME